MGLPVTIKVNFRGNVRKLPVADAERAQWESVEAWIKTTIGLFHFQVKYFDEDNEEVSINSQDEYAEALKSALKQGNQLHMNVYKMKSQAEGGQVKPDIKEMKLETRPAPPYPSRVKTVDKETQVTPERDAVAVKENKVTKSEDESVPAWFRSYMDKFKDQVVMEVVGKMCSEFSGQCCMHHSQAPPPAEPGTSAAQTAIVSSTTAPSTSSTPTCSSCKGQAKGGGYQCSVCTSCVLCERCSQSHDPSHNLKRTRTPLSVPERGVTPEPRFARRGDRTVRKAERQRLKAERRQLKAEVKEIKKKLRLEKRGLLWSGSTSAALGPASAPAPPPAAPGADPQPASPEASKVSCSTLVPTMTALFLDENLPDGTCLEPGTKFIKYWKMRNTGNISWTSDTKLKFMWGNLALEVREQKEVPVPFLQPGQVGVVSVAFVAPALEGTYTSHWRLAHCGEQFGPRVWCSIVVVPSASSQLPSHQTKRTREELRQARAGLMCSGGSDPSRRALYLSSVDMLTAQDLLSFELLDINIVQELDKVPTNTPVDMTPCMSPLPQQPPLLDKHGAAVTKEKTEPTKKCMVVQPQRHNDPVEGPCHEEADEDISGTQFVCETVIRSLTLEEEPDHQPRRRARFGRGKPAAQVPISYLERPHVSERPEGPIVKLAEAPAPSADHSRGRALSRGAEPADWDEVSSQASSASSEDYIVILPDCFDTSRPLGDSMYSSAVSSHRDAGAPERPEQDPGSSIHSSANRLLCTSQTLDAPALVPELVLAPPTGLRTHRQVPELVLDVRCEDEDEDSRPESGSNASSPGHDSMLGDSSRDPRRHRGLTNGLVKGALSVAASAYKALFIGQGGSAQRAADGVSMMAVLQEMGFSNEQLNQRLLQEHDYNLLDVVNELVQIGSENDWYATPH
ncbi:next to BRCA1 gene 1 protein-like [Denticeps clupeoides]|uniref:next to BRCA1 gene 1 protein-like n=1 Tax=Denticeps clupeoides TaxID=299321 RepID=UPI0010A58281|nr:next to BRCA1 gene 1 protein-like [Denticeps clupeoides]